MKIHHAHAKLAHGSAKLQDPERIKTKRPNEIKARKSELSKAKTAEGSEVSCGDPNRGGGDSFSVENQLPYFY